MYAGAASGAVTIGLALVLIMLSEKPDASETSKPPEPETPVAETTPAKSPAALSAVVLPPPPAAPSGPPPASPHTERAPLKPRTVEVPAETVEIKPLKPRPQPVPADAASPPAPEPVPALDNTTVGQVPALPETTPPTAPAPVPTTTTATATAAAAAAAVNNTPIAATPQTVTEGRALLKMLEAGKGPVIEIAWPQEPVDRTRLYRLLTSCYGMQTAILANGSALYVTDSGPGKASNVNRDAISGFIRKPTGATTKAERSIVTRIRTRHGIATGDTVRLFPRDVDAVMLGGLGRIVGPGYLNYRTIRARYRLVGDRITVVEIRVDGIGRPGQVALPGTGRCNA